MDPEAIAAFAAVSAAALTTLSAGYTVLALAGNAHGDGRSRRGPISRRFALEQSFFCRRAQKPTITKDGLWRHFGVLNNHSMFWLQ